MTRRRLELSILTWASLTTWAGCGGAQGIEPRFGGTRHPRMVEPSEVQELSEMPPDSVTIGTLSVECSLRTDADASRSLPGQGECDEWALGRRMLRTAAEVGGTALVGLRCEQDRYEEPTAAPDRR